MRKWHRWLSLFFGVFMLWIAVTGLGSHFTALAAKSAAADAPASAKSGPPAGFQCPETMMCRPKPQPGSAGALVGLFHHLHSGESFGPAGTVISILSGFALVFFSFSGIWLYVQMWRHRRNRALNPKWLWD
jgi:uncharacterized iron-regulated membrane protein